MGTRTTNTARNFLWSFVGTMASAIVAFVSRTVFIHFLGLSYLGVNVLFTNILGLLSLAEMGVGSAVGFSLYKPLAQQDEKKICQIVDFFRRAYRIIAIIIFVFGLCLIPFLREMAKEGEAIALLEVYYIVFLVNGASSYLLTFRASVLSAGQKEYVISNINTVTKIVVCIIQMIGLLLWKNYLVFLLIDLAFQFISRVYLNTCAKRHYPFLEKKIEEKLSRDECNTLMTKIKGMFFHKVGDVVVNQTDNIITSTIINVTTVGLVSNFVMVINFINTFIVSLFNSALASLGDLIATENEERRITVFKRYDFLCFCLYGISTVCLYFLLTPFVSLWLGEDKLIDETTVFLLCFNFYLTGQRMSLGNMKTAAGIFEQDYWSPIVQALINIVVSIIGALLWGLKGVYIGTLVSSMVPNIVRPIVLYKYCFNAKAGQYFLTYGTRLVIMTCCIFIITIFQRMVTISNRFLSFGCLLLTSIFVPCLVFYCVWRKTTELTYYKMLLKTAIKGKMEELK